MLLGRGATNQQPIVPLQAYACVLALKWYIHGTCENPTHLTMSHTQNLAVQLWDPGFAASPQGHPGADFPWSIWGVNGETRCLESNSRALSTFVGVSYLPKLAVVTKTRRNLTLPDQGCVGWDGSMA